MNLLVDAHTVLWLGSGSRHLSQSARLAMVDPSNQLFLSAATCWELAIKGRLGRLGGLFTDVGQFLDQQRHEFQMLDIAVTREHALATSSLPPIHNDPFDRLLIAQAVVEGMTIVTADAVVKQYSYRPSGDHCSRPARQNGRRWFAPPVGVVDGQRD